MINRVNTTDSSKSASYISKKNASDVINENSTAKSYKKKYDKIEIDKIIKNNQKQFENFKQFIKKSICKQGEKSNSNLFGHNLNVSVQESQKAAASISDGGKYSVDAVATRIMDMAISLADGDKTKIQVLRDNVKKGFKAAGYEFNNGKGLPDICNKTYDEIMKRFNEWEKNETDI